MNPFYKSKMEGLNPPSGMYPIFNARFRIDQIISWHHDCIDIRYPTWTTLLAIKQSLNIFDDIYCDDEFRVIVLYANLEKIILMKLEGIFDG